MSVTELCAVLDDIRRTVADYVILPEHGPLVIALWCAHTYLLDEFGHTPRLAFMAPDRECGKTRGLQVIQPLVYKPEPSSNISAAALYRVIEAERPTLLIDEVDSFLSRRDDPIVNILNSGHAREMAYVRRCEGDSHKPTKFSTWGAVAFAGIGALPDTLASRSIIIPMRRRLPVQSRVAMMADQPRSPGHMMLIITWFGGTTGAGSKGASQQRCPSIS